MAEAKSEKISGGNAAPDTAPKADGEVAGTDPTASSTPEGQEPDATPAEMPDTAPTDDNADSSDPVADPDAPQASGPDATDVPAVNVPDDGALPIDEELGSTPGVAMFSLPVRKVIEFCKRSGIALQRALYPGHVEVQLATKNLTLDDAAGDPAETQYWEPLSTYCGDGPASFHSIDKWWTAELHPDGSFEVVNLANTNLASRRPGARDTHDLVYKGPSLETLIAMLSELLVEGDEIIEASQTEFEKRKQLHELAMDEAQRRAANPAPPDPDTLLLAEAAAEHGIQNLDDDAQVLALAKAYGVPAFDPVLDPETGDQKMTPAKDHNGGIMTKPGTSESFMVPEWGDARPIAEVRADVLEKLHAEEAA